MQLHLLRTNTEFEYCGDTYVTIPHMSLHCNGWDFGINVLRVQESGDNYSPPTFIVDFMLPETEVEII